MIKKLYHFQHHESNWYLTDARLAVTYKGNRYKPVAVENSEVTEKSVSDCDIDITLPSPYEMLSDTGINLEDVFINRIYFESVKITIIELEGVKERILYRGHVTHPKFNDQENKLILNCATGEKSFDLTIGARKIQKTCPNAIYDMYCGLDIKEWSFAATITNIDYRDISYTVNSTPMLDEQGQPVLNENEEPVMEIKSYPSNFLSGGALIKNGQHTFIISTGPGEIRLYRDHYDLKVGDVVRLAAGCDQSHQMCYEKFKNHERYGGNPHVPRENPIYTKLIK